VGAGILIPFKWFFRLGFIGLVAINICVYWYDSTVVTTFWTWVWNEPKALLALAAFGFTSLFSWFK